MPRGRSRSAGPVSVVCGVGPAGVDVWFTKTSKLLSVST
jgi:hypothetical protein